MNVKISGKEAMSKNIKLWYSLIIFVAIFYFGSNSVEAATYYVSSSATNGYVVGNDSNAGTSKGAAKLTIASAHTAASTGDTIYVNDGTYAETLVITKALAILPETDYGVTIKRASASAGGALMQFTTATSGTFTLGKVILNGDVTIAGYVLFIPSSASGSTINITGTRFIGGDIAHIEDLRTSGNITIDGADFQKLATGADNWQYAYYTSLSKLSGTVTIINSTANIVANNASVTAFHFLPQSAAAGDGTMTVFMANNTIYVTNNNQTGILYPIRFWNVNDFTFQNNVVTVYMGGSVTTNAVSFEPYNNSPTYLGHTMTGVVRNNTITNNAYSGYGIRAGTEADASAIDDKISNLQIYGNTVTCTATSTGSHGILYGSNTGGNIFNNTVKSCPIGIIMKNMDGGVISGNTIASSTINAIYLKGDVRTQALNNTIIQDAGQSSGQYSLYSNASTERNSSYVVFSNNIVYNTATSVRLMSHDTTSDNGFNAANDYYSTQSLLASSFNSNVTNYASAALWQAGFESTATSTDPLFTTFSNDQNLSNDNFNLQSLSPLVDTGSSTALTIAVSGNAIYGTPDVGAYEYQPPFTVGTHNLDVTGNIRIYGDGKYRYTTATSSSMAAIFSVTPSGGIYPTYAATSTRPEYLNISGITWSTTKAWTASSSIATTTVYTIGDLTAGGTYTISVDGATSAYVTSSSCTSNVCTADGSGQISFTYSGGYSTHTFSVAPYTAPADNSSSAGAPIYFGINVPLTLGTHSSSTTSGSSTASSSQQTEQVPPTPQGNNLPPLLGPFSFTMQGDQVSLLQQYLARDISIYPEGKISGYYGALTKKAVSRFQDRYGLAYPKDPFYGLAGPKTRAKIMEVLGVSTESFITDLKKQIEILQAQITILLEKQKTKI